MSGFKVILVCLALPSLALGDACDVSIEGVTDKSTQDEVVAAWSKAGLARVANARPTLIGSKANRVGGGEPNVDVVAFQPRPEDTQLTGLLHLRWERYHDRGILKIKAQYRPDMPQESAIYQKMEKWSLWPMIAERKKQCVGAAPLRDRNAAVRCQDNPGHLVVDRQDRAYEPKQGNPPSQRVYTKYACQYQFNAGPGPSVTEEITVAL